MENISAGANDYFYLRSLPGMAVPSLEGGYNGEDESEDWGRRRAYVGFPPNKTLFKLTQAAMLA